MSSANSSDLSQIQICTQMPIPPELQAEAVRLAILENPKNATAQAVSLQARGIASADELPPPEYLALPIAKMWATGRTLRVQLLGGSSFVQGKVRQYAVVWGSYANIQMQFVATGTAEIRVAFNPGGSWSYVGTDNLAIPASKPTMNFGWFNDSTPDDEFSRVVIHEFGHALGCIHEHQSPAANIPWDKPKVYDYYAKTQGWTAAQVDTNIFAVYDRTTTQYSVFDAQSIMLYSIPASLTTNGYSTDWNRVLSATDKSFIVARYPQNGDPGIFNTMEVRPWNEPRPDNLKEIFFANPYTKPPRLAVGFNWLDIDNGANIRVRAYANQVQTDRFTSHIDAWGDTILYSAGCTWLEMADGDPDFQSGQFGTEDDHPWNQPQLQTSRPITFTRAYSEPPQVVVWLNQLDMARDRNWRVHIYATNVTATGFTWHIDTWGDSVLYTGIASWIAYPANKANIFSGNCNTEDVRPFNQPQLNNSGRANFGSQVFATPPRILLAINSLDIDCQHNLRLKVSADSITNTGMTWHIDSWADTILYSAVASYIALG
ncbi:MAG TPA: H-type lectin domain-containing protein [Chloroflexia bacterium]|nr:H-type lectin domain-containing protein [Chloroflexia bacterium]